MNERRITVGDGIKRPESADQRQREERKELAMTATIFTLEDFLAAARTAGEAAWVAGAGAHEAEIDEDVMKAAHQGGLRRDVDDLSNRWRRHWRYGWLNGLAARVRGLNLPDDGR